MQYRIIQKKSYYLLQCRDGAEGEYLNFAVINSKSEMKLLPTAPLEVRGQISTILESFGLHCTDEGIIYDF